MVQAATAKKQLKAFEDQDVVALTNEEEQAYQDEIAETDNFLLVVPERQEGETRCHAGEAQHVRGSAATARED